MAVVPLDHLVGCPRRQSRDDCSDWVLIRVERSTGNLRPSSWAACLVVSLFYTHLAVSVVTSWAVIFLVRGPGRWVAWGAIILVGIITGFVALGAAMATTGVYL